MYEIGKITTTHGIKGEVKVLSLSDFDRFKKGELVFINYNNERINLTIDNIKHQAKNLIVKFKEFNNINEVLNFRGLVIYSNKRGTLKKGEYYLDDLYNLEVINILNNELIGLVVDILELPHGNVLVVGEKRVMIPFEKQFIKEVKDDKILIEPIEGLLWLLILLQCFPTFLTSF